MIQIDDAGSGSLIGGTGIGILDIENNKYYFEIIPLKYYQTKLFNQKKYQDYVVKIVEKGFAELNVNQGEYIEICQGYMFDKLRDWLTTHGYKWKSTKIDGLLQKKVEESFDQYVIQLGLPKNFIKHARYAFGFHRLLKWVLADIENRKKLCKTQWKSWQKWGKVERSIYLNKLTYPDYCLKCGQKMEPPLDVITIEYMTNKPATINIHKPCFNGKLQEIPPAFLREFNTIIKTSHKNLNLKQNEKLFLKKIQATPHLLTSNGIIVGSLPQRLGKKIDFWVKKGFNWHFFLKDYSNNQAIIFAKLQDFFSMNT